MRGQQGLDTRWELEHTAKQGDGREDRREAVGERKEIYGSNGRTEAVARESMEGAKKAVIHIPIHFGMGREAQTHVPPEHVGERRRLAHK